MLTGKGFLNTARCPTRKTLGRIEELLLENEAKEILCPARWCQKIDATDFERELEHRRTEFCRRPYGLGRFETCKHFPNKNECWKRYIEVKRGLKREVVRRKGN